MNKDDVLLKAILDLTKQDKIKWEEAPKFVESTLGGVTGIYTEEQIMIHIDFGTFEITDLRTKKSVKIDNNPTIIELTNLARQKIKESTSVADDTQKDMFIHILTKPYTIS